MKNRFSGGMLGALLLCGSAVHPVMPFCSYSSPIAQGGLLGFPSGGLILPTPSADVGGFFWEHGYGDPMDGMGTDSGSITSGFPVGPGDAPWVRRDLAPASIDWDWFYYGSDGCLSAGSGSGVMVVYVLDNDPVRPNYAVLAVSGSDTPVPGHDFDRINTGEGVTGNEVRLRPLLLVPVVLSVTAVAPDQVSVDVASALSSINTHDDQNGAGPYVDLFDLTGVTELFHRAPGSTEETAIPGCIATGCTAVLIPSDHELCWAGSAAVAGKAEPGTGTCNGGAMDTLSCIPDYAGDACVILGGLCVQAPPTYFPMGPEIPGGCTTTGAPQDSDGDGFFAGADCDDTDAAIYPGAPHVCDGRNNDCDHAAWPALPEAECFDVDNLRIDDAGGLVRLDWDTPSEGADSYEICRGTGSDLLNGDNGGTPWISATTNQAESPDLLGPGELSFYLVAGIRDGVQGSLGRDSLGQERVATSP